MSRACGFLTRQNRPECHSAGRRYLAGVIVQRLDRGALVRARQYRRPVTSHIQSIGGGSGAYAPQVEVEAQNLQRVVGLIFVPEHPALAGKFTDAAVSGVVYPVGEYAYTDVEGAPQRVAAWSFSPP